MRGPVSDLEWEYKRAIIIVETFESTFSDLDTFIFALQGLCGLFRDSCAPPDYCLPFKYIALWLTP